MPDSSPNAASAPGAADPFRAKLAAEAAALPPPKRPLRVWIDLDNLPHVPIFRPILAMLESRGHRLFVTARRHAFTEELLAEQGVPFRSVGRHGGKGLAGKISSTLGRAAQLAWMAATSIRPDACASHGSRSAAIAAKLSGRRSLSMFDYEHVHAAAFLRCCRAILLPAELPSASLPADLRAAEEPAAKGCRVARYPGFKESLYLDLEEPNDPAFRRDVIGVGDDRVVMLLREPAATAHYHNPESEALFAAALDWLRDHASDAVGVMLPRAKGQPALVPGPMPSNLLQLEKPLPGIKLLGAADLLVSGGGTMNREAALLGLPTWSIFRGRPGALDAALAAQGRMTLASATEAIRSIPCARRSAPLAAPSGAASRASVALAIEGLAR